MAKKQEDKEEKQDLDEDKKTPEDTPVAVESTVLEDIEVSDEQEDKVDEAEVIVDAVSEEDIKKAEEIGKLKVENINLESWTPKTETGRKVKNNEITDIDDILDNGIKILEPEIVDVLLPEGKTELLLVGQSKGKFGGGQRRVFRQTQKKTKEGNKPKFATIAVFGNENGYVGVGYGKSKETVPSREKAFANAKKNIIKISRGCGSWQCNCKTPHSIPFKVEGKCGSTRIVLMPAPKGTGLCIEPECAKILKYAGIKDVWSKTYGQTKTKINLIAACMNALKALSTTKVQFNFAQEFKIVSGKTAAEEQ